MATGTRAAEPRDDAAARRAADDALEAAWRAAHALLAGDPVRAVAVQANLAPAAALALLA